MKGQFNKLILAFLSMLISSTFLHAGDLNAASRMEQMSISGYNSEQQLTTSANAGDLNGNLQPYSLQTINTNLAPYENPSIKLRLDGIGGDDNGLGEVPIHEGYYILVFLSMLYIIYRSRKKLFNMQFLCKKTTLLLLLLILVQTTTFAADYYWVGANGSWSDISHWATSSGGTIKYTLPPTAADNVFFDGGSGFTSGSKTVTVNQNSFCNNMTWSGSATPPALSVGYNLQVNGSLRFQPGMTIGGATSSAAIIFSGSLPNQTITTGNNNINIPFTFNGTGGWILQDSLKLLDGYTLNFTKGDLDFNGQYVKMGYFASASTAGVLKIANSNIIVTGGWSYNSTASAPLTAPNSVNSQMTVNGSFVTKTNDVYYNVIITNSNNNSTLSGAGIFNNLTFLSGGTLRAFTADTLILIGSKVYNINDNTIKVNKYLKANVPACSGLIELIGAGTVTMGPGAVVDVVNSRIKNVIIQGPSIPYPASNSIDMGGNTGWAFTAPIAQTYYWVGGGGNWNDVLHWANTSGGIGGSGCVPIQLDNVVFDVNSGFGTTIPTRTVLLDGNAACNNMTWNGAPNSPILATNSKTLEINASLQLQPDMTTTGTTSSLINFTTTLANQTVTTANVVINAPIAFNGTGGWSLQDSLKIPDQQVAFINGNLNFNGQYAIMKNFAGSSGTVTRTLNIANSTIDVGYPGWYYSGTTSTLAAPNSVNSEIRVLVSSAAVSVRNLDVYYNVTFLNTYYVQSGITNGIYNKVSILGGNGLTMNNITTDSLLCKAVAKYQLASTIYIKKYFNASPPPCSGLIELISSATGTLRVISMTAGAVVDVSNCRIQDIQIMGSTPYTAASSIDLGNNFGWTFTTPAAHTFYWVGATGNWNDQSHWATTSGGTPGSGCIPTQYDNVIFDSGSGFTNTNKTVTIDGFAYCDSMTWAGIPFAPILTLNQALQVNGSLKFQQGMNVTMNWNITFTSSRPNETVTTGNITFTGSNYFIFNGSGGWALQDSIKTSPGGASIMLNRGNLNFNGQYVKINGFSSSTSSPRTLNIANSTIDVAGNSGVGLWNYTGTGSTPPITTNSLIRFPGTTSTPSLTADAGDVYNNVEFSSTTLSNIGTVNRGVYNKITMTKMAINLNAVTTDTLIYAAGGSVNTFTSATTSVINKLWMTNGTPCLPTTIQATNSTIRANISMPATAANVLPDTILFEFVRIRDLNAVTGADQAKFKKGPQSIDDSGYGLSGNNSNWTMAPYLGASGFNGLTPNVVARGCQDYPYPIELPSVYRPGADGSYEWRKDNPSGPIISTLPQFIIATPGTYYLKVNYDLAKSCSLTDYKSVLTNADTLIWTGLGGNSDWNDTINWKKPNGISNVTTVPRNCTNVFIPSGVSSYPNLSTSSTSRAFYANAACQNIHFGSGAEVAYTDSLYYSKAFVDLTLTRDKWYMLSTPLQNMYSGDYWLAPLGVTAANGALYNRNNPRVYMQQYQIQNPETGYYPGEASWSKAFNTLDVTLGIGQGFVTGVDQPGTPQTFHFPRPETKYEYFSKATGAPTGVWSATLNRANSFRMHIEPGFSEFMPVSGDSLTRSTVLLGNPFMSHLSFSALQAGNPGLFGTTYYVWTGTSFDAFTISGDQSSKTDWTSLTIDQIAPMQSFIVQKQNPASLITGINIKSNMTSTAPSVGLRSNTDENAEALNLAVYRDNVRQSAATILLTGGKDVLTLFSTTVQTPAVVFFGSKSNPYSILSSNLKNAVEVGLQSTTKGSLTFKIQGTENIPAGTKIYLEDKLLNTTQDITLMPTYTFNNDSGNIEGRFFLRASYTTTGFDKISESGITIKSEQGTVYVSSTESIQSVEVFNLQGQMIYKQTNLNTPNYSFTLNNYKQVVVVKVISGSNSKSEKIQLK